MNSKKFLSHFTFWNTLDASNAFSNVIECIKIINTQITNTPHAITLLSKLNSILEGNGLTTIRSKIDETLLYIVVDMGDPYAPSIAYDAENKNLVLTDEGSLREYIEDLGQQYYIDSGFIH